MAITMGQYTVPSSSTVPVFTVPPGPSSVTFFLQSGSAFIGEGTAVTTANGMSVPTAPLSFGGFAGSAGSAGRQLYACGGPGAISYVISSGG